MQSAPTDSTKFYELLAWFEVNKKRVLAAVAAALLVFVVVYVYLHFREQTELEAGRTLLALRPSSPESGSPPGASPADYLKVADKYGSTSAGARALLLAAGNLFADGQYAEARTQFERFLKQHSGGPLAPIAAFGVATSLDALDQVDAALGAYQSVVNQYPEDAVASRARLAMATLHEAKNQPEQAYRIYDELSKQMGAGGAVGEAATRLQKLQRRFPHLAPTNPPIAVATNAVSLQTIIPATNPVPPAATPPPPAAKPEEPAK